MPKKRKSARSITTVDGTACRKLWVRVLEEGLKDTDEEYKLRIREELDELEELSEILAILINSEDAYEIKTAVDKLPWFQGADYNFVCDLASFEPDYITIKVKAHLKKILKKTLNQWIKKNEELLINYATVKYLAKITPNYKVSDIWQLIFNADTNGFRECIRCVGNRILIDKEAFKVWKEAAEAERERERYRIEKIELETKELGITNPIYKNIVGFLKKRSQN